MPQQSSFDAEVLIGELSNSISSLVADELMSLIRSKEKDKAIKLLIDERVSQENAKKITEYLINKATIQTELIEISIDNLERKESEEFYLVRYGDKIMQTSLYERKPGLFYFFTDLGILPIEKVDQIWKIVPKNI